MTLADFLNAQLDEEQAGAEAQWRLVAGAARRGGKTHARRELARVQALRAIVELHSGNTYGRDGHLCEDSVIGADECETLRALVTMYADRPGYDAAWAPIDEETLEREARERQEQVKAADAEWNKTHPLIQGPDGVLRRSSTPQYP